MTAVTWAGHAPWWAVLLMSTGLWFLVAITLGPLTGRWLRRGREAAEDQAIAVTKQAANPPHKEPGHHCGRVLTRVNIHEGGCVWRWDRTSRKWAPEKHGAGIDWDRFEQELRQP